MSKDLHLYANGDDPFTFVWDDVTFFVHIGLQAAPDTYVTQPEYVPEPETHSPLDFGQILREVVNTDPIEIYVPEPESLRPMEDILAEAAGRTIILGTSREGVGSLVKPVVEGLRSGPEDGTVHVWHDDRG